MKIFLLPFLTALIVVELGRAASPLIVVVDGAGDFKGCSTAVSQAIRLLHVPATIEVFPWSHGHYRVLVDQVDERHSRAKGKELAERLVAWKQEQPERPIVLISHSAGCAVALAASSHLPTAFLERQILFAPSVSTRYDLRPTLRASRHGIDAFCSSLDCWALGLGIKLFKTADEWRDREAAGRHGFRFCCESENDSFLYEKLRHHFWTVTDTALGHNGRHHGMHAPAWLKTHVFPLLSASCGSR